MDERDGQTLFGFARRLGLSDDQADDAVQEALLRLFRVLESGEAIRDARAWAFRALYRVAMDEHRLRRRVGALVERLTASFGHRGTDQVDAVAGRLSIWADVDRLPLRQRQVLYLHYKADLAFDEVARVMGITPAGARAVAARGIAALRRTLEAEEDR